MAQQTAIDWLIEQINNDAYQIAFGQTYVSIELIEQAKAMEKEQIIKAHGTKYNGRLKNDGQLVFGEITGEQYYSENYESNT
jgi:hypothetical protein